jgi:hypothetical protein
MICESYRTRYRMHFLAALCNLIEYIILSEIRIVFPRYFLHQFLLIIWYFHTGIGNNPYPANVDNMVNSQ